MNLQLRYIVDTCTRCSGSRKLTTAKVPIVMKGAVEVVLEHLLGVVWKAMSTATPPRTLLSDADLQLAWRSDKVLQDLAAACKSSGAAPALAAPAASAPGDAGISNIPPASRHVRQGASEKGPPQAARAKGNAEEQTVIVPSKQSSRAKQLSWRKRELQAGLPGVSRAKMRTAELQAKVEAEIDAPAHAPMPLEFAIVPSRKREKKCLEFMAAGIRAYAKTIGFDSDYCSDDETASSEAESDDCKGAASHNNVVSNSSQGQVVSSSSHNKVVSSSSSSLMASSAAALMAKTTAPPFFPALRDAAPPGAGNKEEVFRLQAIKESGTVPACAEEKAQRFIDGLHRKQAAKRKAEDSARLEILRTIAAINAAESS